MDRHKTSTTYTCAEASATAAQLDRGISDIITKPRALQQAGWGKRDEEGLGEEIVQGREQCTGRVEGRWHGRTLTSGDWSLALSERKVKE